MDTEQTVAAEVQGDAWQEEDEDAESRAIRAYLTGSFSLAETPAAREAMARLEALMSDLQGISEEEFAALYRAAAEHDN